MLETIDFKEWHDAEDGCFDPVLFGYGNPGVGKTHVRQEAFRLRGIMQSRWRSANDSFHAIDSLCDQARGKGFAVVELYCDFHSHEGQCTTNKQLSSRGGITEHILDDFQKANFFFGGRSRLLPRIVS